MKRFIFMSLMLFSLFSCTNAKKAPVESMRSYSYYYSSSPAYNHNEYFAKLLEDGKCQLGFSHNDHGDTIVVDGEVMQQLEAIYREHKIYDYKEKYTPSFEVLDGDMWGYSARFGEESYSSHGANAGPSDKGLSEINNIIIGLIRTEYAKSYCGTTWEGAIKDNKLAVTFTEKDNVVSVKIDIANGDGTWASVAGDLEAYDNSLASFHGHLKDLLSETTRPVVTCVDVYVKPESEEITLTLSGNDMTPLIEKGIEGATWEDYTHIPMKKTNK